MRRNDTLSAAIIILLVLLVCMVAGIFWKICSRGQTISSLEVGDAEIGIVTNGADLIDENF